MKKVFKVIHSSLAGPLGLIITVICLSGAILVFETEIMEWTHHDRYFAKGATGNPLPLNELIAKVNAQLENNSVASVQIPSDPKRNYTLGLSEGFRNSVYVNPTTGEIIETVQFGEGFFGKMRQLHRWLLDGTRKIGKPVVGYTTLLFVFILISGLVIWWPKSRKHRKQHFQVTTQYGRKRFWLDMHTTIGMYAFTGLLLLALTGLSIQSGGHGHGGKNQSGKGGHSKPKELNTMQWPSVLTEMQAANPNYKTIAIQDGSATVVQKFTFENARASDKYTFDAATGKITDVQMYENQPRATKIRGWIYTLHVGSWGGWFSKTLMFIVSLIGASLPVTGYYIYFVRRKKRLPLSRL
ncbi:MAG: PepSY domain-containing protein [Candidatus Symbiothrix sp.]|jgi:uncharacterized iron-regulated membrane protein|nr:PepSY domain-containing protein [Candidatus Symbiothrix sp.]